MIKTAKELVAACLNVVNNYKTLYVMGCFGAPMTDRNKIRYINEYSFNRQEDRKGKIQAATADTFGFDCICFIKSLFWGWQGDANQVYGGAAYKSNGVPDIGTDQLINICTDVSEDFSTIVPGEYVWLPGHCGIYVGDGLAAEATFEPAEGVQLQCVLPMGVKPDMPATGWKKHGKLPWISYDAQPEEVRHYRVTLEGVDSTALGALEATAKENGWRVAVEPLAEEKPTQPAPAPVVPEPVWTPTEEDIVYFKGGLQYGSANASKGSERGAGLAKITKTAPRKAHPFHLVKLGSIGPYGWVDRDTFEKA